jgi:hypothetical protein
MTAKVKKNLVKRDFLNKLNSGHLKHICQVPGPGCPVLDFYDLSGTGHLLCPTLLHRMWSTRHQVLDTGKNIFGFYPKLF